jgi:membrane protease YdiL (CAAX protease family)
MMENTNARMQHIGSALSGFWRRVPVAIRAIVTGFLVAEIGITTWMASLMFVPGIWSLVIMGGALCAFCAYFGGSWWPKATKEIRRERFRALKLPRAVWTWSLLAAMLFVIVTQSSVVVTFRVVEFPAELFDQGFGLDDIPPWIAWMFIVMSALVAGICEEVGFRGYMQVPLEKRYGPRVAIAITSLVFVVFHLNQAWAPPVLFHLFALSAGGGILAYAAGSLIPIIVAHVVLDVFNFAYWWSDVAGSFEMRPLAETGIDAHFVVWSLVFGASLALLVWTLYKTNVARQRSAD